MQLQQNKRAMLLPPKLKLSQALPSLVVVFCLVGSWNIQPVLCVPNTPGWVIPDRLELPIGSDLNISCTINEAFYLKRGDTNETCAVDDLYFNVGIGSGPNSIYKTYPEIQRVNATSIIFNARNLSEQEGKYLCMCGTNGIFTSRVFVGSKPKPVLDFNCTSYDWDYMFCNFTTPKNSIITKYNISFETQKNSSYRYIIDCNFDLSPIVNCNITGELYKKFSEFYYFRLDIGNYLGQLTQNIEINNFERMILARPGQNLMVINKTEHSICLSWDMLRRSNSIGGVLWQVHVTPDDFATLVRPMWRNNSSALTDTLCLTELQYAGYNYTLELRVRPNKTKSRWSKPLNYVFRTAPSRPERPPRVTDGSFYVYSSEAMLTVYWEQLEKHELNGDNFKYIISEYRTNNTPTDSSNIKLDLNSATIENWNQNAKHEIFIRSSNNVNSSEEASVVVIPPISNEDTRLRVPKKIRSVYHSSNASYSLSWMAPENKTDLINYTVFWCNSKPALQSKCNGSIHFEHVSKERLQFVTKSAQPASLNMAVSANFVKRNTGMHWVICTQDGTNDLAKMEPSVEEATNFTLSVKWSTERVCPSILRGYNLTYCQRSSGKADNCTTKMLDPNAVDYSINNLEPYTDYSVKMLMYSDTTASKYSDELINRTGEASPTQPRQLDYSNVTSSSVILAWKPPLKANGVVRVYKITYYHDNKKDIYKYDARTDELIDNEKLITCVLPNLTAYTQYEISIQACTLYDSEPSNVITVRTAVGVPSQPKLHVDNLQQSATLEWTAPQRPSGRLEYYEVSLIERNDNNTVTWQEYSYIGSQQNRTCVMQSPICTPLYRFYYQVRAVNVEPLQNASLIDTNVADILRQHSRHECLAQPPMSNAEWKTIKLYENEKLYRLFKSEWATHEVSCSPDPSNAKLVANTIEVTLSLIVIVAALYVVYRKIVKMSDITLTLPQGIMENLKKPIEIGSGMGMGPDGGSVGIICTRVDSLPQYMPQDMPHDFSSGNESSKLLLASNSSSSGGNCCNERDAYEEQQATTIASPVSYMSMSQGLLLNDAESHHAGGTELHATNNPSNTNDTNGYIKPTQMKNWSTPLANNANTLPSCNMSPTTLPLVSSPTGLGGMNMPLSGYVPVQVLQAARNTTPALPPAKVAIPTAATTVTPVHLLNTSNYVQAADVHKLKPLAPMATATAAVATPPTAAATTTAITNVPPASNVFGYTAMEQLQRNGLMKPASVVSPNSMHHTVGHNTQTQQHRLQPNIGGYVTPQDLNAIAHHNRQML